VTRVWEKKCLGKYLNLGTVKFRSGDSHNDEICAVLGYYAAPCANCLPTFRDNVSVPSSQVKSLDP
jgi:hypothetical protein